MKSTGFGNRRCLPWFFPLFSLLFFLPGLAISQSASDPATFANAKPGDPPLRLNEVNGAAARHFMNHFSGDGPEKWIRADNFYVAIFTDGQKKAKAYYDSRGGFIYCIKYYLADQLDRDTRSAILKEFEGYEIDVVTEITNLRDRLYFIKIKNSLNIKTLRIADGDIEVTEDYKNAGI
jgi:hypothetical protein